jgi:hypothetical protein
MAGAGGADAAAGGADAAAGDAAGGAAAGTTEAPAAGDNQGGMEENTLTTTSTSAPTNLDLYAYSAKNNIIASLESQEKPLLEQSQLEV